MTTLRQPSPTNRVAPAELEHWRTPDFGETSTIGCRIQLVPGLVRCPELRRETADVAEFS